MPTYNVTYTPTTGGSLSATGTGTATTLGLTYTDAHLAEWRNRANAGPYKSSGDAFDPLIPGEWDRIVENKVTFMVDPTADQMNTYDIFQYGETNGSSFFAEHFDMLDAAFYALVNQDTDVALAVKNELMWHANRTGTEGVGWQISPTENQPTDAGSWSRAMWFVRIITCADFVKDQFSGAELTTFNAWVSDWAYSYEGSVHTELSTNSIVIIATTRLG
jgi:hypothetical protein